tara:strand:- start:732 stop:1556 length:825 start_codon:yes stop_codon:yes gene_type:complete
MFKNRLFLIIVFTLCATNFLNAEVIEGIGDYVHTVETSRLASCGKAKQNALKDAASKLVGETIKSESTKICESSLERSQCELYQNTWSTIGLVALKGEPKIISEQIIKETGYEKCQVTIKVNLEALPKPDKNFDFNIELNQQKFVADHDYASTDTGLTISIKPQNNQEMYINVFHWVPYEDGNNIQKIFPRNNSEKNLINNEIVLPNKTGTTYMPIFPKNTGRDSVEEGIHVVATKEDIKFSSNYTYNDFQTKLIEISGSQTRSRNTMYVVIKK